jgi:hypothetical protein
MSRKGTEIAAKQPGLQSRMAKGQTFHLTLMFILMLCGLLISCEKGFDELNRNPNVSGDIAADELFANAQFRYHTDYFNGVLTEIWGLNTWMQVQANINGIASADDKYFISGEATDNTWRIMYTDVLGNINEAIRLTEGDPQQLNDHSMYRIYRAYIYHRLTDLWGHIPYSEALNVINSDNTPDFTPAYDTQSSIYLDLLAELKSASNALDENGPTMGGQDWIYAGNVDLWKRFANSLRLRLAMRISSVVPGIAQEEIADLLTEEHFITSNTENAEFPYSGVALNPFFQVDNQSQGQYHPSKFLVDKLLADADPRIEVLIEPSPFSLIFGFNEYVGVESFLLSSSVPTDLEFNSSYIGEQMLSQNRPGNILSAAEVQFLLAEVALKGWAVAGSAQSYYEAGVMSHMEQLGIAEEDISTYLSLGGAYTGELEQIIGEKWKTLVYTDAVELYAEWRRTGYPVILDANQQAVTVSAIPVRLPYPQIEINLNAENVYAVGHGVNDFSTPMWWDVD